MKFRLLLLCLLCSRLAVANEKPCELFSQVADLAPLPMRNRYLGEEQLYFSEKQAAEHRLDIIHGLFVNASDSSPFATASPTEFSDPAARPQEESKVTIDVSMDGYLLALRARVEGLYHHSTLVAGAPLPFAGEMATDSTGKLFWASYRSGHYPGEPYRMKIFLDELAEKKVDLSQVYISLSDREGIFVGRTVIPANFFRSHVTQNMDGDDIALAYLLLTKATDFRSQDPRRDWEIEEPIVDIKYFCEFDTDALPRALNAGLEPSLLASHFADWVDHYILINSYGKGRVEANIVAVLKRLSPSLRSGWRQVFYDELKLRHPDLFP